MSLGSAGRALLGLLVALTSPALAQAPGERRSGYHDMSPSLQAMQDDEIEIGRAHV